MENKEAIQENQIIKKRNHITYIIEECWKGLVIVFFIFIGNGSDLLKEAAVEAEKGELIPTLIIMGVFAIALVLILGFYLFRWSKTTFSVIDGMLIVERRTINQQKESIAIKNISNINLNQNIFEMLVGTYRLQFDTSTRSTADKTDVKIVLKREDAYEVKNLIMKILAEVKEEEAKKHQAQTVENGEIEEKAATYKNDFDFVNDNDKYDFTFSHFDIIKNCAMTTSVFVVLLVVSLSISGITSAIMSFQKSGQMITALAAAFFQLMIAISGLSALFKGWFGDFDFRVGRRGDKIYVSHGLFHKRQYAVPVNRINAVRMDMTFISRIFGCYSVRVINVGGEGEDVDGMKILLCGKYESLREKLAVLLPEFKVPEFEKINRKPFVMTAIGMVIATVVWAGISTAAFFVLKYTYWNASIANYYVLGVVIGFALLMFANILSYRADGMLATDRYLVNSFGYFGKNIDFIPYHKIQFIQVSKSPMASIFGCKRAIVHILASATSQSRPVAYMKNETMEHMVECFRKNR